MAKTAPISKDLQKQREYIKQLMASNFDFGLVFAATFVKSIRDLGYKNTGTAIDELIDNSKQSEAQNIHVILGYDDSQKKPAKIAVIDDGHGMDPDMIRAAVTWGGTHRHNDRQGFGRYGYGLPSACLSIGERYTVYSRVEGGQWHEVTIDLKAIEDHFKSGKQGPVTIPAAVPTELPEWVEDYIKQQAGKLSHGTVVAIDKIDRLTHWATPKLKEFLLQHFGVTYRNFLKAINLYLDGKKVEPIDPLFITPGYRFYDLDEDRAEALPCMNIEVKNRETKEPAGVIQVRFSYMPPTFMRVPEDKLMGRGGKPNARFKVLKDIKGIIVMRAGRQIDVVSSHCPYTTFMNNDRYIGVEIDFPPSLDEEFSITTSKQQVVLSDRMWDILDENGLFDAIAKMRSKFRKESQAVEVRRDAEKKRASEAAMETAQKFVTRDQVEETPEELQEGEDNLEREVRRISEQTGLPPEVIKEGLKEKSKDQKFRVDFVDFPGAPFYSVERVGGQKVLYINRAHPFYTDFYAAPDSTPTMRFRLEVMLFVLGDCELKAKAKDFRKFYQVERAEWSRYLGIVLEELAEWHTTEDDAEAHAEILDTALSQAERQNSIH